jgi:hypothetical protein
MRPEAETFVRLMDQHFGLLSLLSFSSFQQFMMPRRVCSKYVAFPYRIENGIDSLSLARL